MYLQTWAQFGGGHGGRVPHFFSRWDIICHVPPLFSLRVCIWRGFKTKCDVCQVLREEFFILDVTHTVAMLMLKERLVWYH